jgi:fatty-acyl-CoA synthase
MKAVSSRRRISIGRSLRRTRAALRAVAVFAQPSALRDIKPRTWLQAARVLRRTGVGPHTAVPLHAVLRPAHTAIADETRSLTWCALDVEIGVLAAGLVALGVTPGDRVAVVLQSSVEHVVAQQAIMRAGATAVQIGYRLTAAEIGYILVDAAPAVVIYHARYTDEVLAARERAGVPRVDRLIVVGHDHRRRLAVVGHDRRRGVADVTPDRARDYIDVLRANASSSRPHAAVANASGLMIYTSGTTGRPKGARRTFRTGYSSIVDFMRRVGMSHRDRHLVVCPLYHGGAFGFVSMMMSLGASTFVMEHFDPEQMLAAITRERLTSAFVVPTMLSRILALDPDVIARYDTSSLRWIASGAAPLPTDTARRFQARFGKLLWNFYGATETGLVTLAAPDDHEARPGTIGRPLAGNDIRLLDERGRDVAPGEVGELYVRNRMLISGYHRNDDATAAAMRDGYFSVGDLARRDGAGYLYLESRCSDMIISGGVNIYPREIEDRLSEHPDVLECAVIGVPDPEWGERVIAFVAPRNGTLDVGAIERHCRSALAGFKCPRQIEVIRELPRNDTGKVLKRVLRENLKV